MRATRMSHWIDSRNRRFGIRTLRDGRGAPSSIGQLHLNWYLEVRSKATCATSPRVRGEVGFRAQRGIRVRGRSREPELVDKPPHPICFASPGLRSQIDLSPHAGRGGASGARIATSKQRAICDCPAFRQGGAADAPRCRGARASLRREPGTTAELARRPFAQGRDPQRTVAIAAQVAGSAFTGGASASGPARPWDIKRVIGCAPDAAGRLKRAHERLELRMVAADVLPQVGVDQLEWCACRPGLLDGRNDCVRDGVGRAPRTFVVH